MVIRKWLFPVSNWQVLNGGGGSFVNHPPGGTPPLEGG